MTCPLCRGAQNLASFHEKRGLEYWPCPCCYGAGVTIVWSPPIYNKQPRKSKEQG
jgi:hypothetical protein